MSENHAAVLLSEGSDEQQIDANANGNEYSDSHPASNLGHDHVTQLPEQSNGDTQSPSESNGVTVVRSPDNAGEAINQMELVDLDNGVTEQGDNDDIKSTEDTAKDDMFVDCSDELITVDGKQIDSKEEPAAEGSEEKLEEDQALQQQSSFVDLGNGIGDGYAIDELHQLRHMMAKTVAEKDSIVQQFQEERESCAQGMLNLHSQLKVLASQQSLEYEAEVEVRDKVAQATDTPLKDIINECLEFAKTTSKELSNSEDVIRNLQALLSMKDQEIRDLNTKVTEMSVANSEFQLEKDRSIEIVIDKMISSLAMVVDQEQVSDDSFNGKVFHIEKGTSLLVETYNQIQLEIDHLRRSFSDVGLDATEQEYGNVLGAARVRLLELKRKEAELVEKVTHLEDENQKIVEELDKERATIRTLNVELGNMKSELEHEKVKYTNTKEKLSMAVTKGKALVQQRDSLKQSLVDKSSELEKCLMELQEKSAALGAAELTKEELTRSENLVVSLQNSLLQSNTIIELVEEILSQTKADNLEFLDIPARLRWLVDDRNVLRATFVEFCKMKDVLSLVDLPESVLSSDLESQMNWLKDSFHRARDDFHAVQKENSTIKEAVDTQIEQLTTSLLLELQEKDYLQSELTNLRCNYEEIVKKNHQMLLEKDQIVKMLVELSSLNLEDEGIDRSSSDASVIINLCFQRIKEQSGPFSMSSHMDAELYERIQTLLYVRNLELMLYEDILEEEMLIRLKVDKLSNELKVASEEILALKEEKSSLQKDLERSEEKSVMLREKLSMAVKKGKGLVQDRDNLKSLINEKNSEIEQLNHNLQNQESMLSEYRDQINRLSSDVENMPKLKADLLAVKGERNQFQQFLLESNNMLQRVMESIDGIVLPADPIFEEPVQKVKWLAGYVSECQDVKRHAEHELQLVKEGASVLESKLAEAEATLKSLEQELYSSESSVSQLAEEKRDLEIGKAMVEEELQKVKEEVAENFATTKSVKDALCQAENVISALSNEKEHNQVHRVAAETELEAVKEEAARQTSKLAEASRTIKDLEDKLSQVESNITLLTAKYNSDLVIKDSMENELKKLRDEADHQASKLIDASASIKALEDALSKARDEISVLEDANNCAKEEISSLTFKLDASMDELAGKSGSLEIRSVELVGLLNDLQVLMKEDVLIPMVRQCFERKFETLKNINLTVNSIRDRVVAMTAEDPQSQLIMKDDSSVIKAFADGLENFNVEVDSGDINNFDIDNIISSFGKIVKGFQLRNKLVVEKLDDFSGSIDEFVSPLLIKLLETEANILALSERMETLKEKTISMEMYAQDQEKTVIMLKKDVDILLSACVDATSYLQSEVEQCPLELDSILEVESLKHDADAEHWLKCKYMETVQKLINAARKAQTLIKQFELRSKEGAVAIENLQSKLKEAREAFETVKEERDLSQNKASQLESDIQALRSSCSELSNKLEGYHALDEMLKAREAEISSLYGTLSTKEQEGATIKDLQSKLNEARAAFETVKEERDLNQNKASQLESDIQALQSSCSELGNKLEGYHALEEKLKEKEAEISSLYSNLSTKEQEGATIKDLQSKLNEARAAFETVKEERDLDQNKASQLESDIQALQSSCSELSNKLEGYQALEEKLKEKEAEISSLYSTLSTKEQEGATIKDLQSKLKEARVAYETVKEERDLNQNKASQLESDIQALQSSCSELSNKLEGYQALEEKLKEKEAEISSLYSTLSTKEQEGATIKDLQSKLKEARVAYETVKEERDLNQNKASQLESDIQALQSSCSELSNKLEGYHALEEKLKENEAEISSLYSTLSIKEQEAENSLLSAAQVKALFGKIDGIDIPMLESSEEHMEQHTSAPVKKLFFIIDSVTRLHHQINSLSYDNEELQSTLTTQDLENEHLKEEVEKLKRNWEDSEKVKNELSEVTLALDKVLNMMSTRDWIGDQKAAGLKELIPVLEKQVMATLLESENSRSKAQELGVKLAGTQKVVDELTSKIKLLEDSLKVRTSEPEIVHERSVFEAPTVPVGSEISEVEEGSLGKKVISPVPSAAHVRTMRKGSTDQIALDIDGESDHLINNIETNEDKGHVFMSLNTSGLVPRQAKHIADRIDGIWVSGGRILMSRPRARLGFVGYLLILHIWLLGTVL